MIIKISGLSDDVHDFVFEEKIEKLELKEPFFGNYVAKIELKKFHNQIILNSDIYTTAAFECDRCGADFKTNLQNKFQIAYLFGNYSEENNLENVVYLPLDTDKINLFTELRDYALLSIPMKKLCREDCKGLCYNCGKNLNEGACDCDKQQADPRWQPLIELKKKMNIN
ncbi:MAG: hypothetical protein A2057_17330 [Ignavibacteria bacterium GWA2_35_9]|nr:MAG: hypothetical protein A2057_17330 [Ignavibacteria bacterium GWA2_35_9]